MFWKCLNFTPIDYTPGNSKQKKVPPLEISQISVRSLGNSTVFPQYFFLVTLGNSTLLLINCWKFHMLFLWYPWKFHILNPPPLTVQGFSYWGEWCWSPPYQPKVCSFPPLDFPHQFLSPLPKVDPPTKQQFSRYNPIKTGFLAVVIVTALFLF